MHTSAAFLGHQPQVSLAELAAALDGLPRLRRYGNLAATFHVSSPIDAKLLPTLGGTVILARGIADGADLEDVPSMLVNEATGIRGKLTFALRTFGMSPKSVRDCYRACKDRMKAAGRPCRYVGNERHPAAAALLKDAGIADGSHGVELVLLRDENGLWVGRTIAAQDPDVYSIRDMDKPVRDTSVGLLPPKLAQVLLTLGGWMARDGKKDLPKNMTIYDPFCGTGVVPMEALMRGWHVVCSDLAPKAVTGTSKNLDWVRKRFGLKKSLESEVFKHDARKPFPMAVKPAKGQYALPHVVVSETTLGPNLRDRATLKDAQALRRDSEKLQEAFLRSAAASLPGVPLVLTWPTWYLRTGPVFLEKIWDVVKDCGYTAVLPPDAVPHTAGKHALLYRRPDQFVGREIVMLKPR